MTVNRFCVVALLVVATLRLPGPPGAGATQKFGPLEISGNLQSQNLARHLDASTWQYVQNRNVARLRLEYSWLEAGRFMNQYDIPFLQTSKLFVQWRGVYDSVYDTTPGFAPRFDIHGDAYSGQTLPRFLATSTNLRGQPYSQDILQLDGLTGAERDQFKFENTLREAYIDMKFRGVPLTVRAGKQQVVWGETDNFRMLDRANSLDLTWHLQQEIPAPAFGWDEIRRTFWMLKFLYDIGDVWRFNQTFLEWYWNPGDWFPAKQAFLPRPWGLPFLNPLENNVDGAFKSSFCAQSTVGRQPNGDGSCTRLMNGTRLFQQGDYERNPLDNSQVGVRIHSIAPFGLEFTLAYFYQRWAGDDGTNYAPLRGLPKNDENIILSQQLVRQGIFPAEAFMPYIHTVGASGNYSDEQYTQAVFRFETVYDFGIPFFDVAKETVIDTPALPGVTRKNMWKGMIAFDRPTWIRWLNKKTTWFLTGQFFWHYLIDNPDCRAQDVANFSSEGKKRVGSCLVGGLDLPSSKRLGTWAAAEAGSPAYRDKIRDWESIFTLAAFSFYRGGSIVPVLGIAVDWVNQWNMEPFWTVDYVVRNDFVVNVGQRYFVTPRGHSTPIFETWGLAGLNAGRTETSVRVTYQF
jgi:hypothetical protein